MMKFSKTRVAACLFVLLGRLLCAQATPNTAQQLVFAGLRSVAQQGQINGVQSDAAGNLYLLLNQGDGVRILKTDNAATNVLAQTLLGAKGDIGLALALDPSGSVYVTGTTTSTTLTGTSGAAIPNRTDASTNSFVAKFDAGLNPLFVSFTGGSRIAAAALSATADAVFVTGITYGTNLPVTANGIQQTPALGSSQNGFVEKFSASGATLLYATYLTGASGDTTPAAIVADASDNAYIAGTTTASGYPTVAALVPVTLSNLSGFLTKLTPAGDGITFSTFVPGAGLSGIAIDSTGQTLLVTGSVALGQFPVDTVTIPLVPTTYQVLLRLPLNGSAVTSSTLIAAGTQSNVAAGPNGTAWIDGLLTTPELPLAPVANLGSGFAAHVSATNFVDQTARFGGVANQNPTFASLPAVITSVAVDPSGEPLIAGAMQPTASSSLLATETYDLPLRNAPTNALPSTVRNAVLTAATCNGSLCAGSAAYLAKLNPNASGASLAFSADDTPFVTLRNLGTAEADGLQLIVSAGTFTTNCGTILASGAECNVLLAGGTAGTLTVTSSGAASQAVTFPAFSATAPTSTIVFFPRELDFDIQTSTSAAATRTITVTNLGTTSQTFTSASGSSATNFTESASDCTLAGSNKTKLLAPGESCHITIAFAASSTAANDGILSALWAVGARDVVLTGYSQAATLSISASEVAFGTQFVNGLRLSRYLYLSNASAASASHAALTTASGSPFTIADGCPATLLAGAVCRIRIDYLSANTTSTDSTTLTLDGGLSVLLTGKTLPQPGTSGSSVNPNLSVTPLAATFASATVVTGISGATQTITIVNTGASAFALTLSLTGDFTDTTSCTATLAAGQTCAVAVSFVPSQPGPRSGLLAVTAGAGTSPQYVALTGTGTSFLSIANGTIDSGSVAVGQPVTQFLKVSQPFTSLTATTTGPYGVVFVPEAGYGPGSVPSSSFATSATAACPNCYLGLQFTPTAAGPQPGTLTLTSATGGAAYVLTLTGIGLPTSGLILTPLVQDFGVAPVHSVSSANLFMLTNLSASGAAVTLAAPALTGDFAPSPAATGGAACGGTLAYSASCFVEVAFAPTATGTRAGTLTLSAGAASVSATLSGLGAVDTGIAINPLALTFANVPGSTATTQTITVTNSGAASVKIGTPTAVTSNFAAATTCGTLAAGTSCGITVTFAPASATVADTLTIPVTTSTGSTSYTVALSGSYTASNAGLEILPNQSQFGPSPVGAVGMTRQFTINNLTAKSIALAITIPRQFVLVGAPCSALAANASCTFSVAFLPLTNGAVPGTLYATAMPADGTAAFSGLGYVEGYGTGAGTLTLTGALIVNHVFTFGQVTSGQTLAQMFTLANLNASGTLTVRRISSQPPFLSTSNCGTALVPGQSCSATVTYAPTNQQTIGTASPPSTTDTGLLTIESDAASSPDLVNLTGQAGPVLVASPTAASTLATFTLSQTSLTFPQTIVGNASASQTLTLTNTGNIAMHVTGVSASADFTAATTCATILPGANCAITVTATPQAAGTRFAALEITCDSTTALDFVSLIATGIASPISFTPAALNFGSLLIGKSATLPVTIANTSSSAITFNSLAGSGDYALASNCPATGASLPGGASCIAQVTFSPTATGTRSGKLSLANSVSTLPLTVALTGVGAQSKLVASPANLSFGSVVVGMSLTLSLTLYNSGTTAITGLVAAATGDFAVTTGCPNTTLAAAASCAVQVSFTPTVGGLRGGSVVIASSDPASPFAVPLVGTGTVAGGFTLAVNGGATASATVVSGNPATYALAITPTSGYTGVVAITCAPVNAAPYALCGLLPASVTLGTSAQSSTATINTITQSAALARPSHAPQTIVLCLLMPGLCVMWRRSRLLRERIPILLALCATASTLFAIGCGGGSPTAAVVSPILYTPAGTYQYQVTASSTTGVTISQSVTLNLTVTAR